MKLIQSVLAASKTAAVYLKPPAGTGFAQATKLRDQLRQELRTDRVYLWSQSTGEMDPLCSTELGGQVVEVFSGRTFTREEGRS